MALTKELLNLAGEYAVASQLARLGHYAQLTFGNRKRTDILVDAANGALFRIEVKAKQAAVWPSVHAPRKADFVILVDYQRKGDDIPPDFYVVNFSDWKAIIKVYCASHPKVVVDDAYCIRHPDGWSGLNIKVAMVAEHRNAWKKLSRG